MTELIAATLPGLCGWTCEQNIAYKDAQQLICLYVVNYKQLISVYSKLQALEVTSTSRYRITVDMWMVGRFLGLVSV